MIGSTLGKLAWRLPAASGISIGISILLGACAPTPPHDEDVLDSRLAGPCDRLTLSWHASHGQLKAGLGSELVPRRSGSSGELQLRVVRCQGRGMRQPPLSFAYYAVPVIADSVPLVVTSVPEDGWWSMPVLMADRKTAGVFTAMGYAVRPAEIELNVSDSDRDASVSSRIQTDEGRLEFVAVANGRARPFEVNRALVTESEDATAAFFGRESANRVTLAAVQVSTAGRMPPPNPDGLAEPKLAELDRALRFDRIYWRLPRPVD